MPWTDADVEALDRALADGRGARSITFGDQSVTFNSIEDMLRLRSVMQAELSAVEAGGTVRTRYAATSKGC